VAAFYTIFMVETITIVRSIKVRNLERSIMPLDMCRRKVESEHE